MRIPAEIRRSAASWDALDHHARRRCAILLRKRGWSLSEIAEVLPISPATASSWCRHVTISPEQRASIDARGRQKRATKIDTQWRRRAEIAQLQQEARAYARDLVDDSFWVAGTVLYWGEGSKTSRRLELANSEPEALRLFIQWTRRFHDAAAEFKATINLHADNDELTARDFWSQELCLDRESGFSKSFVKPNGTGHRKNRLTYGVCRVRMLRSTDAWLTTMAWLEIARETFGASVASGR